MFIASVRFPGTDGVLVSALRAGLVARSWAGVTVSQKLPATKTARMVTVRNDGGLQDRSTQNRAYGINVWADSSVDAENIALDCMADLRVLPTGSPFAATGEFSGPYEVPEDVPFVVGGKNLAHYYFSFVATVRAVSD